VRALFTAQTLGLLCLLPSAPGLPDPAWWRYVLGTALAVFLNMLAALASLPRIFGWLPLVLGHDYWMGQLLELLVSLAGFAWLLGWCNWPRQELGLRLTFNPGTGAGVRRFLLPLLLLELGILWWLIPGGKGDVGYHLLQISAGVTEELAFRGVLLALLDRAFPDRGRVLGAALGWGTVVSAVIFGLCHGLRVEADFHVGLALGPMAIPLLGGLVLAWCRARSGSLLLPIWVHSGMNEVAQLLVVLKSWAGPVPKAAPGRRRAQPPDASCTFFSA